MKDMTIPEGFVMDAAGNLIKKENLTVVQQLEDALVKDLWPRAEELNRHIARFKFDAMKAAEDLIRDLVKEHGIKKFERIQGNVQFVTVDGKYKIQRAVDKKIEANSTIESARQLFNQYLQIIGGEAGTNAKAFIEAAFDMKEGKLNTAKLIELCNKEVDHPLYKQAVDAIRKSLFVTGTKSYLRFYKAHEDDDKWIPMPLQFSAVEGLPPSPEDTVLEA